MPNPDPMPAVVCVQHPEGCPATCSYRSQTERLLSLPREFQPRPVATVLGGAQLSPAISVEASAYEKLRADSATLNAVGYTVAKALGIAADGRPVDVDIPNLVDRLIADRDKADEVRLHTVELFGRVNGRCGEMEAVVEAARMVADWWPPPANLTRALSEAGNALAAAVAELDATANGPLSDAETRSTPGEYPGEGGTGTGDLKAIPITRRTPPDGLALPIVDDREWRLVRECNVAQCERDAAVKRLKKARRKIRRLRRQRDEARAVLMTGPLGEALHAIACPGCPRCLLLHRDCAHPDWEYTTTSGPRKSWSDCDEPPEGDGWMRNAELHNGWQRLEFNEVSYWRRPKPTDEVVR